VASGGKDRSSREARERARVYQARQQLHASEKRRRTRDNIVAAIAGGVIVLAAIGAQVAYFTAGPGAPEPTATTEPTPTPGSDATTVPSPDATSSSTPEPEATTPAP
jgi:type II secretory pathway pseudopilin PulG